MLINYVDFKFYVDKIKINKLINSYLNKYKHTHTHKDINSGNPEMVY